MGQDGALLHHSPSTVASAIVWFVHKPDESKLEHDGEATLTCVGALNAIYSRATSKWAVFRAHRQKIDVKARLRAVGDF